MRATEPNGRNPVIKSDNTRADSTADGWVNPLVIPQPLPIMIWRKSNGLADARESHDQRARSRIQHDLYRSLSSTAPCITAEQAPAKWRWELHFGSKDGGGWAILQSPAGSSFLFGPRGTSKSTWLQRQCPDALVLDLLPPEMPRARNACGIGSPRRRWPHHRGDRGTAEGGPSCASC